VEQINLFFTSKQETEDDFAYFLGEMKKNVSVVPIKSWHPGVQA
jgi:hypothetical protein